MGRSVQEVRQAKAEAGCRPCIETRTGQGVMVGGQVSSQVCGGVRSIQGGNTGETHCRPPALMEHTTPCAYRVKLNQPARQLGRLQIFALSLQGHDPGIGRLQGGLVSAS